MAKKPLNVEQGVQLDKQGSARTYNERDEGLLYNNQNLGIRVQTEGADRELLTDTQIQSVQNKSLDNTNSLVIKDTNLTIEDESSPTKNIKFDVASVSTSQVFRFPDTTDEIVTKNFAQTISGKSIDADTNTISNLEVDNFKSGVVITSVSSVSTNNEIPTSQAVFGFVSSGVATDLSNHLSDTTDAHDASAISNIPSGNLAATDQQGVNNELQSDIDTRALDSAVVHKTGNESIAGIKTFSDTTQSTTKDDGGAIFEGGVGIEKNLNVGGDVVITGGLQVNGTTTFVNTTNMQVADATIEVNKGGNQAAANSADAGIEVVMTDATTAKIGYDSTLASKFAIGEVGSLKEIVDVSSSQTLSGKTIDGDVNTLQDVGISSLKTVLADASKFIARDGSGAVVSTNTVPSGTVVGTSDTQVLTNKDIDGGTASNSKRITIPKDTVANLNSLTRKEATVVYATDTDKLYVDDGSTLNPVGSGGVGNPAVYSLLKSDEDTGTWSTGNNATFLGGGSIAGTFTKQNATNPLNGTYSYTLVQAAGSLNDYIASDVQAVPLRSRGVTNSTDLVYTYDGSDNDIKWVVYDVTNATVVTPVTAYVKASSVGKTAQLVYDLPVTCTQVRFGAQVVVANSGKTLKFDDVQLSTWTPQAVNLNVQEILVASGTANGQMPFTSVSGEYGQVIGVGINSVVIKKKALIVATGLGDGSAAGNLNINWYNSSGTLLDSYVQSYPSSGAHSQSVPFTKICNVGDYLTVTSNMTLNMRLSVTASAISENVVQSWQDGTEWTSYTPTFSAGFGTVTNAAGKWKRSGSDLEVFVSCTTGTVAGSLATVSLPSGLSIDSSKLTINNTTSNSGNLIGTYNTGYAGVGTIGNVVTAPSTSSTLFYFGAQDGASGLSSLAPQYGTSLLNNNVVFSFYAKVPIAGWSSTPTLLALPTSKSPSESATFSNAGTIAISSMSSDWITSISRSGVGTGSIDYAKLSLTKPPALFGTDLTGNGRVISFSSITTTSATWKTESNSGSAADGAFSMKLEKQSPDYTAPGVFVGNVAKNQVAIVEYRGNSSNITLSGTAQAMPTNTVTGDSGIVSVGASSFTLQSGEYELDAGAIHYLHGGSTGSIQVESYIYNTTDNVETKRALPSYSYAYYATSFTVNPRLLTRITITKQTTFEFRHRVVSTTNFTGYLGFAFASPNDINGYVKITKLNGQ